jgi:hypothetical protein
MFMLYVHTCILLSGRDLNRVDVMTHGNTTCMIIVSSIAYHVLRGQCIRISCIVKYYAAVEYSESFGGRQSNDEDTYERVMYSD